MLTEYNYISVGKAAELDQKKDRILYRAFEILPGFLAWGTLLTLTILSFKVPAFMAIFMILFDFFWLLRISYLYIHLGSTFRLMKKISRIDWLRRLDNPSPKDLKNLSGWRNIYHLMVLPFYKEEVEIIRSTLNALAQSEYPVKERCIIVLGAEQRAGRQAIEIAQKLKNEYQDIFSKFLVTVHPQDIPRELTGKGANTAWAGKEAKKLIDELKIPYENIIVSSFDIDTVVPKQYLARLTYVFLNTDNRLRASYQPIPLYINNFDQTPPFSKIASFSTTFWAMMNQERHEQLKTFSSHSMPFRALVDVGFWKSNIVTEDNEIFFQCFLRYDGDYRVIPLYFPVYMDANATLSFWRTLNNVYKQHRRWGWGVETIPFMLYGFLQNKKIALRKKVSLVAEYVEGFWSWATAPIIMAFFGILPPIVGGNEFKASVLALNLSDLTSSFLNLFLVFLVFSAIFMINLIPSKLFNRPQRNIFVDLIHWVLTPVIMIALVCLPALESQTRLMLGKYMGFWATPKTRAKINPD